MINSGVKGVGLTALALSVFSCSGEVVTLDVVGGVDSLAVYVGADGSPIVSVSSLRLLVGDTAALSAEALNTVGQLLPDLPVSWSSSPPAVVGISGVGTVHGISDGSGTVTATVQDVSQSLSVVVVSPPVDTVSQPPDSVPSGPDDPVDETREGILAFSDDFDSGQRGGAGGYGWVGSGSVFVSSDRARSGSYSLKFEFEGGADPGLDGWAEQRFFFGELLPEVWMEYYLWVPANYEHRDGTGSDNNKFFYLWDSGSYPDSQAGRLSVMMSAERISGDRSSLIMMRSDQRNYMAVWGAPEWSPALDDAVKGRWNRIRIHVKAGSGLTANDGVFRFWWDDDLRISQTSLSLFDPDDNGFRNGYLLGYANSGFNEITTFFVDDWMVYKTDPGW